MNKWFYTLKSIYPYLVPMDFVNFFGYGIIVVDLERLEFKIVELDDFLKRTRRFFAYDLDWSGF